MNSSLCRALLALPLLCAAAATSAQTNTSTAPTASASDAAPPELQKPSALIAPAIDHLGQVVSQVQLERWKSASRDETDTNLRSVERNLKATLPDLVTAADAQPASIAASLPVLRNLDALCAVMIRVSVTARANAPTPQAESLAGALTTLQSARNTLADQVQTLAATQENQISSLNKTVAALSSRANPTTQAPASKPAPPPANKPKLKKKPGPKPVQP